MDNLSLFIDVLSLLNCVASPNKPIDREGGRERDEWVSDELCFLFSLCNTLCMFILSCF